MSPHRRNFYRSFILVKFVCLLNDVAESNKKGKYCLVAVESNISRSAATGFDE